MRIAVVAEYYPRPSHPGWGIWAHRQALAVKQLGIDVEVIALERPLPPLRALRAPAQLRDWFAAARARPRALVLDGVPVRYARFVSPPRPLSYGSWGRWAAPAVGRALDELDRAARIDLVHAHSAVPAGDAALRWREKRGRKPLVVSVHGGDLSYAMRRTAGREAVTRTLQAAEAVLANSSVTADGLRRTVGELRDLRMVHLGADIAAPTEPYPDPTLVTVAHLERHKSQSDVIRALATLRGRHPRLSYVVVGQGPDRDALARLAGSLGVGERVRFTGALTHDAALAELARCHVHVMPSVHDAFGVAHIEAMAAGVPTIGGAGTGAEDIARAGEGILLVRAGDVSELTRAIDHLVGDENERRRLGEAAQRTVAEHFSWERCGRDTLAVYRELAGPE